MKKNLLPSLFAILALMTTQCKSGLVTMSNSCGDMISAGQSQNKLGNYSSALDNFNKVIQKCDAYDAKEKAFAGKAAAQNGLQQYNDALTSANQGLKINKTSIDNLFEKSNAELGLGMNAEAKADLASIVDLTQKNRNTAQRATIYAKMAEVNRRRQSYDEALQNIQQAIVLDNGNMDFYMQRGDIHSSAGNFSAALGDYDEAIAKGKNDAVAWKARSAALVKMYQKKYETDSSDMLSKKLSSSEKDMLCKSIHSGQEKGMKDINLDLLQASVCK